MRHLLLNCDQVFEVLTRGPFPTGSVSDDGVEQHLRACHECRQLAEALRPAVALLHEAVAADVAANLPEYKGTLPLHREPENACAFALTPRTCKSAPRRESEALYGVRLIAASVLIAAVGALLYGVSMSPAGRSPAAGAGQPPVPHHPALVIVFHPDQQPDADGLLTLASFHLPRTCLPGTHRPLTTAEAAAIFAELADGSLAALHCCTECHHAGMNPSGNSRLLAMTQASCQLCHRG